MSINKWKELNKYWLCNYNHFEQTEDIFECWLLHSSYEETLKGDLWWDSDVELLHMSLADNYPRMSNRFDIEGNSDYPHKEYFLNWKQPTQQEKDMYEMLTGVKIMWSEEHPFKTLEDE